MSLRAWVLVGMLHASVADPAERPHESVHLAAADGDPRRDLAVRARLVDRVRVVERAMADTRSVGIRVAHIDVALRIPGEPVRTWERAEVVVEGPVLHHHEDQMIQVEDARLRVDRTVGVGQRAGTRRVLQERRVDAARGRVRVGLVVQTRSSEHAARARRRFGAGRSGGSRARGRRARRAGARRRFAAARARRGDQRGREECDRDADGPATAPQSRGSGIVGAMGTAQGVGSRINGGAGTWVKSNSCAMSPSSGRSL